MSEPPVRPSLPGASQAVPPAASAAKVASGAVLPPPPRRIELLPAAARAHVVAQWVRSIFTLIALGLLMLFGAELLCVELGTKIPIESPRLHQSSGTDGNSYWIECSVETGGKTIHIQRNVLGVVYQAYASDRAEAKKQYPLVLRTLTLGPYERFILVVGHEFPDESLIIGFIVLLFDTIIFIAIWAQHRGEFRKRWLYRFGRETRGTIIGKKIERGGESDIHLATYQFSDGEGNVCKDSYALTETAWKACSTGDTVVVLYDKKRPKNNIVHQSGEYKIAK